MSSPVQQILDQVVRERAAGRQISDADLLAAHPEVRDELAVGLERLRLLDVGRVNARCGIADGEAGSNATTEPYTQETPRTPGCLQIRCPYCRETYETPIDIAAPDIVCQACGSSFSLTQSDDDTRSASALQTLGHFDLVERIGIGGCGTVWKGRDTKLDRTVAIKVPRQGTLEPRDVEKFLREARAAAQLKHRNIVSVHEVGRHGDTLYIVSDYVRGITLTDCLTGLHPTANEVVTLCIKIAEALHHAHEQGVIHRDLKPSNIMVDYSGEPHLMDFGLARRDMGEVTMTVEGQILGTPAYMSPEQAVGEGHSADRRTDIYSLGVILFELLTGERPFRGNAQMLIQAVIHDAPPSPRKLNGTVPRDLETITMKCLEKEPGKRYATAQDVANELRRWQAGEPIVARPCGTIGQIWRWYERNSAALAMTAGGYATIIGAMLILWGIAGLLLTATGAVEMSLRGVAELLFFIFVFYPFTAITGLYTLRGSRVGLVIGTLITAGWTFVTFLTFLGKVQFDSLPDFNGQRYQHTHVTTLLLLLASIGLVLHFAALTAPLRKGSGR